MPSNQLSHFIRSPHSCQPTLPTQAPSLIYCGSDQLSQITIAGFLLIARSGCGGLFLLIANLFFEAAMIVIVGVGRWVADLFFWIVFLVF